MVVNFPFTGKIMNSQTFSQIIQKSIEVKNSRQYNKSGICTNQFVERRGGRKAIKDISKAKFLIITSDFNAKLWQRTQGDPENIGSFGLGDRNERGEMLLNFLAKENLYFLNTFFQKPTQRKWTLRSPGSITNNEIDYIISNTKTVCRDVSVLNTIHTSGDHILVRVHFVFDLQKERNRLFRKTFFPTAEELETNKEKYQEELENKLQAVILDENLSVDQIVQNIESSINTSVKNICSRNRTPANSKLSINSLNFMNNRRRLRRHTEEY
ncbi:craniofacial development protein 2-like [Harmonia axyridis]|uniref:craniofacial development protein 2-like n=1 Tax=Harmonia axyridis TaxID=115357 RepID=UPI001E2797C8|nr:craniofacial development protein 2-like [Harmonia axyridis]